MAKRIEVKIEMTAEELHERYRHAKDAVERTHWHMLWRLVEGKTPQEILRFTTVPQSNSFHASDEECVFAIRWLASRESRQEVARAVPTRSLT